MTLKEYINNIECKCYYFALTDNNNKFLGFYVGTMPENIYNLVIDKKAGG